MSDLVRDVLEERREQALRDIADVEAQRVAGELDDATAARLTKLYEADAASAVEALEALDREPPPPADHRRTWIRAGVAVAAFAAVAALAVLAVEPRPPGGLVTGGVANDVVAEPTGVPRDLSTVSNEEMEEVVAANPTVVPMRLALVERYLDAGELQKARDHAEAALEQDPSADDRARGLRYLGWTTALLGEPEAGATLVEESLELRPQHLDSLWFLANIRLEGLGDPASAVPLLERILAADAVPEATRQRVQATLAEATAASVTP